jgi:transposase-like protein
LVVYADATVKILYVGAATFMVTNQFEGVNYGLLTEWVKSSRRYAILDPEPGFYHLNFLIASICRA